MKASEKILLRYLEGTDKHFIIPVYQRNYDWKEKQCAQLYNDLIAIVKNNYRTHFLGSLVSIYSDNGNQEYLVIDGQQRLTTITLLLLALHNYICDKKISVSVALPEKILNEYLINKYAQSERKIRLKPIKNDNNAFEKLFSRDDIIKGSNVTKNYTYFYERIDKQEITCDELFNAIQKLIIVDIELKREEDDPQLIFESLNSTGLNLSQSDLVRNYILMKETPENQNLFYEKYWNKIEINTLYKADNFIRDYLTYKMNSIPNKDNVYLEFKKYVETQKQDSAYDTEEFLTELLKFSKYYKTIIEADTENASTKELLKEIYRLDITVSYPFLLEVMDDEQKGIIDKNELNSILKYIISYTFRRTICEVPTNALNKIFMTMGKEIKKYPDYKVNYLKIFEYILTQKRGSQRFPDNDEFNAKIKTKDIYNMQSKSKNHLFKYLEIFDNKEKIDFDTLLEQKDISIEHIMPQTLSLKWKEELGENYEEIHNKYLHTLGNLTLTGYNSKYSNQSFSEKKNIEKGFNESTLHLNAYLKTIDAWNKYHIKTRAEILAKKAMKIWKYPDEKYLPVIANENIAFLLSEEPNLTGEKIYQFEIMDAKYKVDSWKDLLERLLLVFYDLDGILLSNIVSTNVTSLLGATADNYIKPIKISENIFVESNLSTHAIMSLLNKIAKKYGMEEDISIYIRNKDNN